MTAVHQPQPGDRYAAPWGEYCVVRVEPDRVALRDLARPTACVVPTPAKLLAEYSLVRAATPAAEHRDVKPANVPPPAAEQLRRCSDCKRPSRVLWATDRADGPEYCGACLATGRPPPAPSLGTWRPAPGEEAHNAAKAELGSFARPAEPAAPRPRPKPETARTTTRELWAELSAAVPR